MLLVVQQLLVRPSTRILHGPIPSLPNHKACDHFLKILFEVFDDPHILKAFTQLGEYFFKDISFK